MQWKGSLRVSLKSSRVACLDSSKPAGHASPGARGTPVPVMASKQNGWFQQTAHMHEPAATCPSTGSKSTLLVTRQPDASTPIASETPMYRAMVTSPQKLAPEVHRAPTPPPVGQATPRASVR